jgi:hypothetical protein
MVAKAGVSNRRATRNRIIAWIAKRFSYVLQPQHKLPFITRGKHYMRISLMNTYS